MAFSGWCASALERAVRQAEGFGATGEALEAMRTAERRDGADGLFLKRCFKRFLKSLAQARARQGQGG